MEEMRWPLRDKRRRDARDLKLAAREEAIADRVRAVKRKCPCNICMGESFSMCLRPVVRDHLRLYGRHPYHRGATEVSLTSYSSPLLVIRFQRLLFFPVSMKGTAR